MRKGNGAKIAVGVVGHRVDTWFYASYAPILCSNFAPVLFASTFVTCAQTRLGRAHLTNACLVFISFVLDWSPQLVGSVFNGLSHFPQLVNLVPVSPTWSDLHPHIAEVGYFGLDGSHHRLLGRLI